MQGLAIAALAWFLHGCVGMKTDPNSTLPSNAPADWESTTFGVPF